MELNPVFSAFSILGMCLITVGVVFAAFEGGFHLGAHRGQRSTKEKDSLVGPMVGAIIGLLAFMLSFTFGVASSHFDTRQQLVLEEANTVRTAYAMAGLLAEAPRNEAQKLLREYIGIRSGQMGDITSEEKLTRILARSNQIQDQLWSMAMEGQINNAGAASSYLYVQALNDMANLQAKRIVAGTHGRISMTIWILLYGLVIFGMAAMGYHAGLVGVRGFFVYQALIFTFSFVLVLIFDLDRPRPGLFRVSQQAMIDLHQKISAPDVMILKMK